MSREPKTGIIVLSAAAAADTIECFAALKKLRYNNRRVVLAAHGAAQKHLPRVLRAHPGLEALRIGDVGPITAVNEAIRHFLAAGDCEFILVLSGESVADPDMLSQLVTASKSWPAAAAFGAKALFYEMPDTVRSLGGAIDTKLGLGADYCVYDRDEAGVGRAREVDYISGATILFRADALAEVGLPDETYYDYLADVDWCERARCAGFCVVAEPEARAWVKNREATGPLKALYLEFRNRPIFMIEHYPENMPEFETHYIEEVRRGICDNFRTGRPRLAAAVWLGFDDFCEGRLGLGRLDTLVASRGVAQWDLNAYDRTMLRAAALLGKIPFRNRLLSRFRRALCERLAEYPEIIHTAQNEMEHTG